MIYAATGHRPNKLGGYNEETNTRLTVLAHNFLMENELNVEKIISGMALGWDQAWAIAGIGAGFHVTAAIPFKGQELMWRKEAQDSYNEILRLCHEKIIVCEGDYAAWKMQVRNKWMVDHCDVVVALWDGSSGGTANCVKYAKSVGKPVINLWDRYDLT